MPRVRLAQPFDAFHGTVSGLSGDSKITTFSTAKAAGVARKWVNPANPQSTNQMLIRGYQIAASAAYKALTQVKAALWIAAAEQINRTNILSLTYSLSGINLFCMINIYRQIDAVAIVDDLPAILAPPIPTSVTSITLTNATTLTVLAAVPGLEAGGMAMCRVSPPLSSDNYKATKNDVRIIGTVSSSIVVHAAQVVTFVLTIVSGAYDEDDPVGIEITPLSPTYFPGTKYLEPNIGVLSP